MNVFNKISLLTLLFLFASANTLADNTTTNTSTSSTVANTSDGMQTSPANNNTNSTTKTTTTNTTTTTTVNDGDANIVSAVYAKYAKDSALIGTALTVSSSNGFVTINGSVTSQSQADQAVILVKTIEGVKNVSSKISVATNPNVNKASDAAKY